ncbi:hypothetical protein E2C01_101916 [Portunus trituberculatus]|uniref:Uncharacterized protein n=1 Tax=Portunus trituberculatus TaxID=210409 RepID=A0A5B7KH38_PORTR|nr:hypothetical protein [Portunus trituberculatus]
MEGSGKFRGEVYRGHWLGGCMVTVVGEGSVEVVVGQKQREGVMKEEGGEDRDEGGFGNDVMPASKQASKEKYQHQ